MDMQIFYKKLDELFELDFGTINGGESLSDAKMIDSMSMLGLISFLDQEFDIQIKPNEIMKIGTTSDLFHLIHTKRT